MTGHAQYVERKQMKLIVKMNGNIYPTVDIRKME